MTKNTYTIKEIITLNHSEIKEDLKEIKTHVMKTNSRVNKLENWQYYSKGAIAIIVLILVPLAFIIVKSYLN